MSPGRELRRVVPGRIKRRFARRDLRFGLSLPGAVVDVDQRIDDLAADAARLANGGAGRDAASERARADLDGLPAGGNAARHRLRLR